MKKGLPFQAQQRKATEGSNTHKTNLLEFEISGCLRCGGSTMADEERFQEGEGEEQGLIESMAVLDFDLLCSTVALQAAQGKWRSLDGGSGAEGEEAAVFGDLGGGVLRMWEGEVLGCFEDRRIALQSSWSVFVLSFWDSSYVSVFESRRCVF